MALRLTGTTRHEEKMGPFYLVTSLCAVSNGRSTLKIYFFLFAEKVGFDFFMTISKKPMLSEYGTLRTVKST